MNTFASNTFLHNCIMYIIDVDFLPAACFRIIGISLKKDGSIIKVRIRNFSDSRRNLLQLLFTEMPLFTFYMTQVYKIHHLGLQSVLYFLASEEHS